MQPQTKWDLEASIAPGLKDTVRYKWQLTGQYRTSLGCDCFRYYIFATKGQTCPKLWINWWKWDANCLLASHPCLAIHPSRPHTAGDTSSKPLWDTPARFWRLQGVKFPNSGTFVSSSYQGDCYPFPYQAPKQCQPQRAAGEMVARKRRWGMSGMNPVSSMGTHVLCRAVTEPRGRKSLQKLSLALQSLRAHLHSQPHVLLSASSIQVPRSWCLLLSPKATAGVVAAAGW